MSLAPNTILGEKYRLVRPLDDVGMGSLWLAEHLSLAAPVVVKLVTSVALTPDRLRRFKREACAAAAARSPHVVQVLDHGVDDGTAYIVMELLQGESLAARLQRLGRIEPQATGAIVRQLSRALARAHDSGIVHRDLRPANIFLARNEDEEVIKLLGFGISMGTGEDPDPAEPTRIPSLLGTPCYMSPEQLEGSHLCDHRADIWALGVITFECLVGQLPFAGKGIGGLVLSVCSDTVVVPSEHGSVPVGFDAWFARACARSQDERFETVRDAERELRRALGPELVDPGRGGHTSSRSTSLFPLRPATPHGVHGERTTPRSSPPVALPPITAAPSSTSLEHGLWQRPRRSAWLVAPLLSSLAVVLLVRGLRCTPDAAETAPMLQPPAAAAAAPPLPILPLPPPGEPAPPQTASLVASGEGADLLLSVDGDSIGSLPREVHGLAPGEHSITISAGPRYLPYEARLTLEPGQIADLGPVRLEVAKGLATIVAGEGATGAKIVLKLGSRELPLPPLPVTLEVNTSEPHTLLARRKGYDSYEEPLTFEAGQAERTFSVSLEKAANEPASRGVKLEGRRQDRARAASRRRQRAAAPRTAEAASGPATFTFRATPEASVLLDGVPMGTTPLLDVPVSAGSHRVIFIHGGRRKAVVVTGVSGKNRSVSARFTAPVER
jgi:serine/threonine protein kinase